MSEKRFATIVLNAIYASVMVILLGASSHAQQSLVADPMVPLPDPNPMRSPVQTQAKPNTPPHPKSVETPDWSEDEISSARNQCAMMLAGTGAVYKRLDPIHEGRCGAPAPVELTAIGNITPVKIQPPARVTCGLAATLSAWMDYYVQPSARRHLGAQITQIRNVASYVCRNRYGSAKKPLSEHALANAFDMAAFQTEDGAWITVLDHWALPQDEREARQEPAGEITNPLQPSLAEIPQAGNVVNSGEVAVPLAESMEMTELPAEAVFLNEIQAAGCTLFGTVLGPKANEAHKNHYHYDMAARSNGNYCE